MPDTTDNLKRDIERAADKISRTWPLYSYVTSNPLSGLEDSTFTEAVAEARSLFGGRGFPSVSQFRQALDEGRIDRGILEESLRERGLDVSVGDHLESLEDAEQQRSNRRELGSRERTLNQILEKWLSSFLDEGQSRWSMPDREKGFYRSWKQVAQYDRHIPNAGELSEFPEEPLEAIETVLSDLPEDDRFRVFTFHLTALPDWVGYIKQRSRRGDKWASDYPINPTEYLAVRLILADRLGATIVPKAGDIDPKPVFLDKVRAAFLEAWEETYRDDLVGRLRLDTDESEDGGQSTRPSAQMVFCIDTRSEIIRRHIESTGDYDTHGYAGFFGVPVRFRRHGESARVDACPPIVQPEHDVHDRPRSDDGGDLKLFENWMKMSKETRKSLKNIKDNIASAFNYVELSGLFYGLGMIGRTLLPGATRSLGDELTEGVPDYHEVTEPDLDVDGSGGGMEVEDKVTYAASAFELMGWDTFAPLVVFVGHSSDTSNNPFDSSLRCGACSGNSGVPSARILASICNEEQVRTRLRDRGFDIPDDTFFLAGEHNTTTDDIQLITHEVPRDQTERIEQLRSDLDEARRRATSERIADMPDVTTADGVGATEQRAADWAQTRPEWGLAGNASFIVGPNRLRENVDLEGRAFLHSYDWRRDPDGSALVQIFNGPVVVCQWINHQYYFSTIDNRIYGSGSKITHNPVGNFGVLQGNGGALMGGLPLQSLMRSDTELQHEPIRILTIVHAPLERVEDVLDEADTVKQLVANDWIHLEVIDPKQGNEQIRLSVGENDTDDAEVVHPAGVSE